MRLGVLFAGIPRKPFQVALEHPHEATLGDPAICSSISETLTQGKPSVQVGVPNPANVEPYHCYMRFYAAVVTTSSGPSRFLYLMDADASSLPMPTLGLRSEEINRPPPDVVSTYLRPGRELPRDARIVPLLASLVGDEREPCDWQPRGDEIHVIVSVCCRNERGEHVPQYVCGCDKVSWDSGVHMSTWPRQPALRGCSGSGSDADFHSGHGFWTYQCFDELHLPAGCAPLPRGSMLLVKRHLCRFRRQGLRDVCSFPVGHVAFGPFSCGPPGTVPFSQPGRPRVPSLRKWAAEAALVHLLRTDTPLFLDSVDCVAEARLVRDYRKVLCENVICYFKFLSWGMGKNSKLKAYVNPQMVELLDWVVMTRALPDTDDPGSKETANPLRLMVFVDSKSEIDPICLPTEFPSIRAVRV